MHQDVRKDGTRAITMKALPGLLIVLFILNLMGCSKKETVSTDFRSSIVLLSVDSLRPDFLGCYGNPLVKTPGWDMASRCGWTFSQVYCQAPYTVPSLASLMTSLYPFQHNARTAVLGQSDQSAEIADLPLSQDKETWARFLTQRGYETWAALGGFTVSASFSGLNNGFQHYNDAFQGLRRTADQVTDKLLEGLANPMTHPHFLWAHYYDAHFPYEPGGIYKNMYLPEDFLLTELPPGEINSSRLQIAFGEDINPQTLSRAMAAYAGAISQIDNSIIRLKRELSLKMKGRKIVYVFTADHGESLVEHKEIFDHGTLMFDTSLRIPLILDAGLKKMAKTTIITTAVSSIDVWPTIDDFLGYSRKQSNQEGRSLKAIMQNKAADTPMVNLAESKVLATEPDEPRLYAVVLYPWKLIFPSSEAQGQKLLFDLAQDPIEKADLAGNVPDKVAELENIGREYLKRAQKIDKDNLPAKSQDEETKNKLKSLGYLGD